MGNHAAAQCVQFVAAFEQGDDTAAGMPDSKRLHLLRDPDVVRIHQLQHRHIVVTVRVESRGDKHHLGLEPLERRQPVGNDGFPELPAAAAGGKGNVHHALRAACGAAVWIERMLERRHHQHALVVAEDVFGAVAVMDVEIDDRNPREPMVLERMGGRDRDVIEDAKPHGTRTLRVVPGRPDTAERILRPASGHHVGRKHRGAGRAQRGIQGVWIHCRVGIEVDRSVARRRAFDGVHIARIVYALEVLARCGRRIDVQQEIAQTGGKQLVAYRLQPERRFRMSCAHVMQQAIRMRDESGAQAVFSMTSVPAGKSHYPRYPGIV